jgi:hypothetical protein
MDSMDDTGFDAAVAEHRQTRAQHMLTKQIPPQQTASQVTKNLPAKNAPS